MFGAARRRADRACGQSLRVEVPDPRSWLDDEHPFFRNTPTELQFIDNRQSSSEGRGDSLGAEFHRDRSYSVITNLPAQGADSIVVSLKQTKVKGETMVRRGGPADKFFILVDGEAPGAARRGGTGAECRLAERRALFGEVAIMRDQSRSATVRATSDLKLLALERETFRDLIVQAMEITPDFDRVIRARPEARAGG